MFLNKLFKPLRHCVTILINVLLKADKTSKILKQLIQGIN
jgi:hypothetical protein